MTSYVFDTHACLFALGAKKKLGASAARALRQVEGGSHRAWIPAAAVTEILMLRELGRTPTGLPELRAAMADAPGFAFLPLDLTQLDDFAALASIRDPFDRLIVAAARATKSKLITKDESIADSGLVDVVWA